MTFSPRALGWLLIVGLAGAGCQSGTADTSVAADLNSSSPAVAAQAQKVQALTGQLKQQEAVIEAEKAKLEALHQQLDGARQNLEGLKKEAQTAQ